ncbi:Uncharacterised protein [Legionella busanensis]|uniref:Uncharacterized protein n=1 Tax=Legionella busanensis TaxID=190655 RepID=A0A378KAQ8_9GAMM|nr:hypothetical protein [Legionella busanensis]STX81420.1 Uncharacterised protein [Legionella busanensis]
MLNGIDKDILNEANKKLIAQSKALNFSVNKNPELACIKGISAFRHILPNIMFFALQSKQEQSVQPIPQSTLTA